MGYNEDEILVKDRPSATYDMLLKRAEREGRVGGSHTCPVCGMKFRRGREAVDCCRDIAK